MDNSFLFFVAHLLLFIGLGYVPPASHLRKFLLLLIVLCCLVAVGGPTTRSFPGQIGEDYVIGFIFHASHFLCLVRLSPSPSWNGQQRNTWAFNQLLEARWGIAYIPPFRKNDPKYVPSRSKLLISRLWTCTWSGAIAWCLRSFPLRTVPDDFYGVPNGFLHRLSEMEAREVIIRNYFFFAGMGSAYLTLLAAHSLVSCVALALGDRPQRWPPLFGSVADAYSLRRWYSLFWHHLMRKAFTSHAVFIVTRILRLPRNGQITRYLVIFFTFLISALLHILAGPGIERCSAWPQLRYYLSTIGAIFLEDAAITVYKRFMTARALGSLIITDSRSRGTDSATTSIVSNSGIPEANTSRALKRQSSTDNEPSYLWKLVGYTWVMSFHVWTGSKLVYGVYVSC